MFIECQVNFSVLDPRGWVNAADARMFADNERPLADQAKACALDWITRRNQVFQSDFTLRAILSVFYQDKFGFWRVANAPKISWSIHDGVAE